MVTFHLWSSAIDNMPRREHEFQANLNFAHWAQQELMEQFASGKATTTTRRNCYRYYMTVEKVKCSLLFSGGSVIT